MFQKKTDKRLLSSEMDFMFKEEVGGEVYRVAGVGALSQLPFFVCNACWSRYETDCTQRWTGCREVSSSGAAAMWIILFLGWIIDELINLLLIRLFSTRHVSSRKALSGFLPPVFEI